VCTHTTAGSFTRGTARNKAASNQRIQHLPGGNEAGPDRTGPDRTGPDRTADGSVLFIPTHREENTVRALVAFQPNRRSSPASAEYMDSFSV
jgi:hypothetical protein